MDAIKTGEFLRILKKAKGLTQEEVAERLFVSLKRFPDGKAAQVFPT